MTDKIHTFYDIRKRAMLEALEKSLGIVTQACKATEVSRETHYRWLIEDADYKERVESISEMALDFAESQLYKQIAAGEVAATIFYLKTKGKKRGFIERTELTGADGRDLVNITVSVSKDEENNC